MRSMFFACILIMFYFFLLLAHNVSYAQAGLQDKKGSWHSLFREMAYQNPTETAGDTVRIYIDRAGDIYPNKRELLPGNSFATGDYKQALWTWFYAKENKTQLKKLSDYCKVPIQNNANVAVQQVEWERMQDTLAARIARDINQRAKTTTTPRPLVALVHGYNNAPDASTFYPVEHSPLLTIKFPTAVWMEVRWDGLQKGAAWTAAQLNARLAGAALRAILSRTSPNMPVRIFTHSAGGIVACHALWNASPLDTKNKLKEENRTNFSHENPASRLKRIPTPANSDIRLGMMAPALTSLVFVDYNKRTSGTFAAPRPNIPTDHLTPYRIVLGQNMRDVVLNKFIQGPWALGDTGLGCKPAELKLARGNCGCPLVGVELSTASDSNPSIEKFQYKGLTLAIAQGMKGRLEVHRWDYYWQRPKAAEFVNEVLK